MEERDKCTRTKTEQKKASRRRRRDGTHIIFAAVFSVALAVSTSPQLAGAAGTRHIKATAYYYPEKFTERNGLAKPENLDFTKISRVNFASFQLNEGGSIWGTVGSLLMFYTSSCLQPLFLIT